MTLRYHARAVAEIRHELGWYGRRGSDVAYDLALLIEETVAMIGGSPLSFPVVPGRPRYRRAVLQRFPFSIVYVVGPGGEVVIVALAHAKRRPRYWMRR